MKLFVVFLVAFLLGVSVRAVWIMAFPLHFATEALGQQTLNITELTLKTLFSMLWTGLLSAVGASLTCGLYLWARQWIIAKKAEAHPLQKS